VVFDWLTTVLLPTQNGNDIGCRSMGRRAEEIRMSDYSDGPYFQSSCVGSFKEFVCLQPPSLMLGYPELVALLGY